MPKRARMEANGNCGTRIFRVLDGLSQMQTFHVRMECTGYRPQVYCIETNRINGEAREWTNVDADGWTTFDDDDKDLWSVLIDLFPPCWAELLKQLPEGNFTFKLHVGKWINS